MDLKLDGRKALVTGGSRGIGKAIAGALVAEGCTSIAICARGQEGVDAAAEDLRANGATVVAGAVDVGDKDAYTAWVEGAVAELGGLDVFVSNSSASAGKGEKGWYGNFEVDVMGLVRGFDAALPALQASDAASVIVISTTAAVESFGDANSYGALKAAIINYANGLSQKYGKAGIRVNTVSPGPIEFEGGAWAMIKDRMPEFYEGTQATIPFGRMGTAEEVANAVAFLASPAASWITGVNLVVDGGFTKRVAF